MNDLFEWGDEPELEQGVSAGEDVPQLRPAASVLAQPLGDETVLLDLRNQAYFVLNATGSMIWSLVNEGLDADAITDRVASAFEVPVDRASSDVRTLLAQLLEQGLIEGSLDAGEWDQRDQPVAA